MRVQGVTWVRRCFRTKTDWAKLIFLYFLKAASCHLGISLCSSFKGSSVQLLSHLWLFVTPWTAARQPPCPSPTPRNYSNSCPLSRWYQPTISSSVVPFSSCPQLLPASVFSNESTLHMRWPKYWSFSFSIILSKEHPRLISFRMDWLDLLAVQGTLKSLLQHHSSKASVLQCSAFFTVQLSRPYMTTGKTIALTRQTFVGKVMPLLGIDMFK